MSDSYKSNNLYFTINKTQNSSEFISSQKFRIGSFIGIVDYLIKEYMFRFLSATSGSAVIASFILH